MKGEACRDQLAGQAKRSALAGLLLVAVVAAACGAGDAGTDGTIRRFVDAIGAADRSFRLDVSGSWTVDGMPAAMTASYEIRGPDFQGTVRFEAEGGSLTHDIVQVEGRTFSRRTDLGHWELSEATFPSPDPLIGISIEHVGVVGRENDGHRLRLTDPSIPFERILSGIPDPRPWQVDATAGWFDVVADSTGRPLAGRLEIEGRSVEPAVVLAGAFDYRISDWGAALVVEAPLHVPDVPGDAAFAFYNQATDALVIRDRAGRELPVAACDVAWSMAFNGDDFDIVGSDGTFLYRYERPADQAWATRAYVLSPSEVSQTDTPVVTILPPCEHATPPTVP